MLWCVFQKYQRLMGRCDRKGPGMGRTTAAATEAELARTRYEGYARKERATREEFLRVRIGIL